MKRNVLSASTLSFGFMLCLMSQDVLSLAQNKNEEKSAMSEPVIAVEVIQPELILWDSGIVTGGSLAPWQESTVSAEVGGMAIVALNVDVGTVVTKGQALITLNSAILATQLSKANATVNSTKASLALAKSQATRGLQLSNSQAVSAQDLEQLELSVKMAQADLDSAIAQKDQVLVTLQQSKIVAFDDGIISARHVSLGEVVSVGQALFSIIRQQRIEWRAELDSTQVNQVIIGMTATLTAQNGNKVTGTIRQISPKLNSNTRLATAYIDLQPSANLIIGDYLSGEIIISQQQALTLPASAIVWRDGRSLVFTVNNNGAVKQHVVELGRTVEDRVEVLMGITPSVNVIKQGGAFLVDGDQVTVVNSKLIVKAEAK